MRDEEASLVWEDDCFGAEARGVWRERESKRESHSRLHKQERPTKFPQGLAARAVTGCESVSH